MKPNPHAAAGTALVALALLAPPTRGQGVPAFSVYYRGQSIARPDATTGAPISEADVLGPGPGAPAHAPLAPPGILFSGADLGLQSFPNCVGQPPGTGCGIEVDALSRGNDAFFAQSPIPGAAVRLAFSVDEFAVGIAQTAAPPAVWTEALGGDVSSDVMVDLGLPPGPVPPPGQPVPPPPFGNVGMLDGDGAASASGFSYPGLGLLEPNLPTPNQASGGDNLDALDLDFSLAPISPAAPVYFSLDGGFADPLTGLANTASAAAQGVSGAAVLRADGTGAPVVWAFPGQLGLELAAGDEDDLDALILWDNGDGVFQPSSAPYQWEDGSSDMLLFSVRRGSSIIGRPDSLFGIPIEPGDILMPPVSPAGALGPGGNGNPAIFIAAEALGLATVRSGQAALQGDDLDAAETEREPYYDCNHNGIDDAVDIATGGSSDANLNGIPDECEPIKELYCFCADPKGPCGNHDPTAGCENSTGGGAFLDVDGGTSSVTNDDLLIRAWGLPSNANGIIFMGSGTIDLPFGDGRRCVGAGGVGTFRFPVMNSGVSGQFELSSNSLGSGIVAYTCAHFPPAGCISPGDTRHFQAWFRDPPGPCGSGFNLSNGLTVLFTP